MSSCNCGETERATAQKSAIINPPPASVRLIATRPCRRCRICARDFCEIERQLAQVSGADWNCRGFIHVLHDACLSVSGNDRQFHSAWENRFTVPDFYADRLRESDELLE